MRITEITLKLKDSKTRRSDTIKSIISDGKIVTSYSDPQMSFNIYNAMRKQESNFTIKYKRGFIIEIHPSKKREELVEKVKSDCEKTYNDLLRKSKTTTKDLQIMEIL